MNRVLLTGRLTRDPELRTTAGGKAVAQFSVASHEYVGGKEKPEFHNVVAWDRLAETCGRYLGKGQQVALEGRLQTRTWDDELCEALGVPRSTLPDLRPSEYHFGTTTPTSAGRRSRSPG